MNHIEYAQVLWDYLCLRQTPAPADVILGFGCYNEDIPVRAAQLYRDGFAPLVMFTGGLGRNTSKMWTQSEASRFARIAMAQGIPESAILIEDRSTNTGENILFCKALLAERGIPVKNILGVHKPYMERRIAAAWGVYWPEMPFAVTSFPQTLAEYVSTAAARGRDEKATIEMIAGDFQRMDLYARRGFQLPQQIPEEAWEAFRKLVKMGYTGQVITG